MATSNDKPAAAPKKKSPPKKKSNNRVAVIAGLRTPFARQGSFYSELSALDLGIAVVSELLAQTGIDTDEIERLIFGQVLVLPETPNIAREIVIASPLKLNTDAYSVSRACATSFQSVANIADAILLGDIDTGIAGGADSTSVVPIQFHREAANILVKLQKQKTLQGRLQLLKKLRPKHLLPVPPAAAEYSTGLTMGQSAEQMAKDYGISRSDQDALALRSHQLASAAWDKGLFDEDVMRANFYPYKKTLVQDENIRADSSIEKLAKLRPVFDRKYGTITAANATPLSDGASAVILMSEAKADALGYKPLGYIKSYAFSADTVKKDLLMGPSFASPKALKKAKMTLKDMDLIDMHEAFAAQTLANMQAFSSTQFAREKLGRRTKIGDIDNDKFNVNGGSIAFGHPFAATGTRILMQTLRELQRRGGGTALTTACAAGGLGAAMIVESE